MEESRPEPDVTTLQRLVRLKMLLADALAQAADTSTIGRHRAVIALDGICENAMGIALDWLGEEPEREFPRKLTQLGRLLMHWNVEGRLGVSTLHAARNQAQHHGVVPDGEEVARWGTEADHFIRSLVLASFNRPLQDVHTADAIGDEELCELLRKAERELDARDAAASFQSSWDALDRARRRWRSQRERQGRRITPSPLTRPLDRLGDELRKGVAQLDEYVEVSVFATDFGEYVWLSAQRGESARRSPPTEEDARRALVFALSWILRWESFNARFPEERWERWWSEQHPPETGLHYPQPAIIEIGRPQMGTLGWFEVSFQLADVPYEKGEVYGERWDTHIYSAYDELLKREDFPLPTETRISIRPRGELKVEVPRDGDFDAGRIFEVVERLITATQRRYEARLVERQEALRKAEQLAKPYRVILAGLDHPDVKVEQVGALLAAADPRDGPAEERISVTLKLGEGLSTLALENLIRQEWGRQDVHGFGGELSFSRNAITPDQLAELIVEAGAKLRERVGEQERAAADRQQRDGRLLAELRERLRERGLPQRDGREPPSLS